ncbi:hypothetical protein CHUAL_009282 [Chamberlinius hualienensis]
MGSRLRENPSRLIECFLEVVAPTDVNDSWILQKFPESFNNAEVLKCVGEFAYPCDDTYSTVQHFSFVLTDVDSKWTYGFCRHAPNAPTCFCVLSHLPWHETFYKLLDRIAEITHCKEDTSLNTFLERVYNCEVPVPGTALTIKYNEGSSFEAHCPDHLKLPTLPEHRNLIEYYSAIDAHNMVTVFASLLNERRILICSSRLSRLSACVQAASALIFPMHWQHIFIPILPLRLIDYLSAPIPFLIGVPMKVFERVKRHEIGDAVILHADNNRIETPFDDLQNLPVDIVANLKRKLKNPETMRGDGIARAFLDALVELIGGYRDALKFNGGQKITFSKETFVQSRPTHMQPYLEKMLHLQIFQQFIEERLEMLNSGKGLNDIFEEEVSFYAGKSGAKFKMQYKEWMGNFKKESGALFRSVKSKAYPAVKQMRDRSKKAYKEVRSMFHENFTKDSKYVGSTSIDGIPQSSSAPSSPTLQRPTTIHGTRFFATLDWPNSSSDKYPNYTPLGVEATSPDIMGGSARSPSPDFEVKPINMDLMGDLREFIFPNSRADDTEIVRNLSAPSVPLIDRSLKPHTAQVDSYLTSNDPWHVAPPLPPPRAKRSILHTSKDKEDEQKAEEKMTMDISLIRLDSEDSLLVFDPLSVSNETDSLKNFNQMNLGSPNDLVSSSSVSPLQIPSSTTATSPALNNPVYFHVVPSQTFDQFSTQSNATNMNGRAMGFTFPSNMNSIKTPSSFDGNIGLSSSVPNPLFLPGNSATSVLGHNNNLPYKQPVMSSPVMRLTSPTPPSFLHDGQSLNLNKSSVSPCQRTIVFDSLTNDFLVHDLRSSPTTSASAERKQWQTFE